MLSDLESLVKHVGELLISRKLLLANAASCTGGMAAEIITSVSGSSNWFVRGFITYSNAAKQELLWVSKDIIQKYGAAKRVCIKIKLSLSPRERNI